MDDVWLSFAQLKQMGIVNNWQTLGEWQRDPEIGFPLGKMFGPNSRRWSKNLHINPWLESRPTEPPPRRREVIKAAAAKSLASPHHISKKKHRKTRRRSERDAKRTSEAA